ncbi:MAG: UDP-N-acetylglucosamine 2-epimerase [Gammaproteobacteria bacterium]|nr:UDP-N-acetylglucosamine 2-epimerase [Gammaproteobacteria bacterium]
MRQCLFVIGTRAQLVKIAPVLTAAVSDGLEHIVWFTGQHDESIDDLIADFELQSQFVHPASKQERSSVLRLLTWLPGTFFRCRKFIKTAREETGDAPLVVVHGDTLSTFVGALAARTAGGLVVHLESGLSSGRIFEPFPEEILRRLTFRLSHFALCPNDEAFARMQAIKGVEAVHTGENTLLDCVRFALDRQENRTGTGDHFVASIHRFGNIYKESTLAAIVDELIGLSLEGTVIFVLHPATEQRLRKYGLYHRLEQAPGISLSPRIPYTEFLGVMGRARCVISDGGSNQEELSYLGVPAILFRECSERPDGIGENIIFRHDIDQALPDFVRSGGLEKLRRDSRLDDPVQPSGITVDALARWSK